MARPFEFCPYCGRAVASEEWTHCPACGKSFTAAGEPAVQPALPAAVVAPAPTPPPVDVAPVSVTPVGALPTPVSVPARRGRLGLLLGLAVVGLVAVFVVGATAGFLLLNVGAGPTPEVTYVVPTGPASPSATPGQPSGTFVATGSMSGPRAFATATMLKDGRVLVAGGADFEFDTSGSTAAKVLHAAELYDPATGTFSPTGSMAPGRYGHTATALHDGRVLIAGGTDGTNTMKSAQLYDPATGTFTDTGSMAHDRFFHTATLLKDGRVLIAGGSGSAGFTSSVEVYNPATGTFSPTGSMAIGRAAHTATRLDDGRVLVAGGASEYGSYSSAELYDSATGTFTATGSMGTKRALAHAIGLPGGRVLIVGGGDTDPGLLP